MNKNKKIALYFFIGAICFYIGAVISFLNRESSNTMWILFLCIGSSLLAIGGTSSNKGENNSSSQEK